VDRWIYLFHFAFYAAFLPRFLVRSAQTLSRGEEKPVAAARFSRGLVFFHMLGMGVLYRGVGRAVFGHLPRRLFPPQRLAGAVVLLAAIALVAWTLAVFRSWRLRASLEAGHELSTDGPFRLVRHPIYLAMDLLAVGTLLWLPDPLVAIATVLVALGGDLRARAEEKVLLAVFGDRYREYGRRVQRFVPGVY
jgi:protein-S-isoprenylcysteine O-methyltransferase Ste14